MQKEKTEDKTMDLQSKIRSIPDYPVKGILFRDITTLLRDGEAFSELISRMADLISNKKVDVIVSPEARGFIVGAALAVKIGAGFIPLRKPNKLPSRVIRHEYELEYGKDILEMHSDAINQGDQVLIVDDLLATGGTIEAVADMVEICGGKTIGACFSVELIDLRGRERLKNIDVYSVIELSGE